MSALSNIKSGHFRDMTSYKLLIFSAIMVVPPGHNLSRSWDISCPDGTCSIQLTINMIRHVVSRKCPDYYAFKTLLINMLNHILKKCRGTFLRNENNKM